MPTILDLRMEGIEFPCHGCKRKSIMNWEDSPTPRGSLSVPIPMEASYCLEPLPIDAFHDHHDDNDDDAFSLSSCETSEQMALEKELASPTHHQEQESGRKSVKGTPFPKPHNNTAHPLEDPNRLAQKLDDLRLSLNTLVALQDLHQDNNNNGDKVSTKAYQMAFQQNSSYVTNSSFFLGFLRAERYDASKAAKRVCLYMTEKLQLFGHSKLTRDILLDDLGDDGLRVLQIGGLQILPHKDTTGRTVVFGVPAIHQEGYTLLGARKAHFYFWTSLAEDDDEYGRINGVVGVLWRVHNPFVHPTIPIWISKIRECAPVRLSAYHHCHGVVDNHYTQQLHQLVLPIMQKVGKLRYYRDHYGTSLEIQYTLYSQYGCPAHYFPILMECQKASSNALFHDQYVQDWLARRIHIDTQKQRAHPPPTVTTTTTPGWSKSSEGTDSLRTSIQFFDESMHVTETSTGDQSLYQSSFFQLLNESFETIPDETSTAASAEISTREEESKSPLRQTKKGIPNDQTSPRDVLLGRGRPLQLHPGNQRFRQWIENNLEIYEASNKLQKTKIAESIVQEVYKEGGRFLKQQHQLANHHQLLWEEIDDSTARLKVAYTFRTFRRQQKQRSGQ